MLKLNKNSWLLEGQNVRYLSSPNCNDRPENVEINLLVIHNISLPPGEFGGPYIDLFFTNDLDVNIHPYFKEIKDLTVSSHCLIRRDGEIVQYVPFNKRAWHAGLSSFQGKDNCNDYAIGIELEGIDVIAYTEQQYQILSSMIILLRHFFPSITEDRIVGHSAIAPDRKTDPGPAFDWLYLASLTQLQLEKTTQNEQYDV